MKDLKWLFNGSLLWAALCGWLIIAALGTIRDGWDHRGPGRVVYEYDVEDVPEAKYKRNAYATGITLLGTGVFLWVLLAKVVRDEAATAKAEAESLRIRWHGATPTAMPCSPRLDEDTRKRAEEVAHSSETVLNLEAKARRTPCYRCRVAISERSGNESSK